MVDLYKNIVEYAQTHTVSFVDLDWGSEMIIFELSFITFKATSFFEAAGAVAKIGSSLKSIYHFQIYLV